MNRRAKGGGLGGDRRQVQATFGTVGKGGVPIGAGMSYRTV